MKVKPISIMKMLEECKKNIRNAACPPNRYKTVDTSKPPQQNDGDGNSADNSKTNDANQTSATNGGEKSQK